MSKELEENGIPLVVAEPEQEPVIESDEVPF